MAGGERIRVIMTDERRLCSESSSCKLPSLGILGLRHRLFKLPDIVQGHFTCCHQTVSLQYMMRAAMNCQAYAYTSCEAGFNECSLVLHQHD